jgi:threonine aldolase
MRQAMADAEVGDDVYGEDPTVNRLQERAAEVFGKDAGLFVPTGSMGNMIAVKLHTQPGQEIIIEERGHIFNFEMGTPAFVSGVVVRPVKSKDGSGHLRWDEIAPALHIDQPYYSSPTGLICLENSHNFAGGSVMTAEHCADICDRAHAVKIPVHMDGARVFNASVALQTSVSELTAKCDSVQFCLSKGLGAPVGSMLVGSKDFIAEARIWRKRLGGGMRQVGVLAAAGLVALEESPKRLHEDHANARRLAEGLASIPGVGIDVEGVATNIVIFDISGTGKTANDICVSLKEQGILAIGFGNMIRMVTHCDVAQADIDRTVTALNEVI